MLAQAPGSLIFQKLTTISERIRFFRNAQPVVLSSIHLIGLNAEFARVSTSG